MLNGSSARGLTTRQRQGDTKKKKTTGNANTKSGGGLDDMYALPFSIAPQDALDKFRQWAHTEQGLSYVLSSVRLQAAYCPVWSFDLNLRFVVVDNETGKKRLDWKPTLLQQAYGKQSIVHLPGVSAYAGYQYRRTLVNAVHNTTLIFLGTEAVPFGPWMLKAMQYLDEDDGQEVVLEINPDPWNATRRRALSIVQEEWQALAQEDYDNHHDNNTGDDSGGARVQVQTQVVHARRVYMPTYVVEYSIFGVTYQAFVSGVDQGAAVSGVSHQLWQNPSRDQQAQFAHRSVGMLQQAYTALQHATRLLGSRNMGVLILGLLQVITSVLGRLLLRIPVIAAVVGVWVTFRKVLWPYWTHRVQQMDWEYQREQESKTASTSNIRGDDFVDTTGTAERFFQRNRESILHTLSGRQEHAQGDYDWYEDWMEWARRVYEQERQGFQQQQQQQYEQRQQEYYGQQQQQQQSSRRQGKPKTDYKWDFDPNDPYSVLKVSPSATSQEISQAFRREMLKHHPDRQANATPVERERATERSKIISEAYQKLKKRSK